MHSALDCVPCSKRPAMWFTLWLSYWLTYSAQMPPTTINQCWHIPDIQMITCTVQAWQLVGLEEVDLNNLLVLMVAHTEQNLSVLIFFRVYQGRLNICQIREEFQDQFVCLEAQNVKLIEELLWKRNTVSLIATQFVSIHTLYLWYETQ